MEGEKGHPQKLLKSRRLYGHNANIVASPRCSPATGWPLEYPSRQRDLSTQRPVRPGSGRFIPTSGFPRPPLLDVTGPPISRTQGSEGEGNAPPQPHAP